jgi:hypothetical protein
MRKLKEKGVADVGWGLVPRVVVDLLCPPCPSNTPPSSLVVSPLSPLSPFPFLSLSLSLLLAAVLPLLPPPRNRRGVG